MQACVPRFEVAHLINGRMAAMEIQFTALEGVPIAGMSAVVLEAHRNLWAVLGCVVGCGS